MNGKGDRSRVMNWAVYRDNYDSIFGGGEVSDILERLRGYNPPDRTSDSLRAAQDISDAADEIERLRVLLRECDSLLWKHHESTLVTWVGRCPVCSKTGDPFTDDIFNRIHAALEGKQ